MRRTLAVVGFAALGATVQSAQHDMVKIQGGGSLPGIRINHHLNVHVDGYGVK
jgi:hypothetical protein